MFGFITRTISRIFNTGVASPARWLLETFANSSDSGISVTDKSALTYPPVWYAINKISGHIIQMPLNVFERVEGGGKKDNNHPVHHLLRRRANPFQSSAVFLETLMVHTLLHGNGKAAIIRNSNRQPSELLIIPPEKSVTCYIEGEKYHLLDLDRDDRIKKVGGTENGFEQGAKYVIPDRDVLHIPGLSLGGVSGLQLFDVGKNAIGLGLASEKATNKDFANASRPGILLEAPQNVLTDDKDAKDFIDGFNKYHQGLDNHGRAGLLRNGITAKTIPTGSEASNWVEQRRFQRQEIALLFLLESILGDDSSVSYNSLEQKNLAYLSNSLMRWLVKIEQECDEKLLSMRQKQRRTHYFKFNTAVLLRADFKTTIEALGSAVRTKIMNPNEARAKLDMLPYEGGDVFMNPAIYIPENEDGEQVFEEITGPEDVNRAAIVAHLKHMIGVESKQVLAAAGNKRNYLGWLDSFYSAKWEQTLSRSVEGMGGDAAIAAVHCQESHNQLLEVAGAVTPDGLADAVAETVENWPNRAESLATEILNGAKNVQFANS